MYHIPNIIHRGINFNFLAYFLQLCSFLTSPSQGFYAMLCIYILKDFRIFYIIYLMIFMWYVVFFIFFMKFL